MKCVFCEKKEIRERSIIENDLAFAFLTNIPITEGHTLVSPKRCAPFFEDMTEEEILAIFELVKKMKNALKKVFGAEAFNFAWNDGELGGQAVPHFHLHIVPRKKGDTGIKNYDPRKFLYRPERDRPQILESDLQDIAKLLQKNS